MEDLKVQLEALKNDLQNNFETKSKVEIQSAIAEFEIKLKRASESEISQIASWQKGKEALTNVYQKKELELHIAHLESMVKLYEGLDLTILDEKEREKVMKFITDATNKIASLKAAAKGAGEQKAEHLTFVSSNESYNHPLIMCCRVIINKPIIKKIISKIRKILITGS